MSPSQKPERELYRFPEPLCTWRKMSQVSCNSLGIPQHLCPGSIIRKTDEPRPTVASISCNRRHRPLCIFSMYFLQVAQVWTICSKSGSECIPSNTAPQPLQECPEMGTSFPAWAFSVMKTRDGWLVSGFQACSTQWHLHLSPFLPKQVAHGCYQNGFVF